MTRLLAAILAVSPLLAGEFSTYRGFVFGANVATVSKQAGLKVSDVRVIQRRPAVIEELDWRPLWSEKPGSTPVDPVRDGVLRFYQGELFQIVTTYDHDKVEGMTEADLVTAISATYGPPAAKPTAEIPFHSSYGETAPVIALWETPEYAYHLIRSGDQSTFAMVLTLKRLEALAKASMLEATRLDTLEAPQNAIDLLAKQERENRLTREKARLVNKPNFRP